MKKVQDVDSGSTVRLQLWDTAGQERFRAISRLYYRGASAVLLVYSIIDQQSFEEMGTWLKEMKDNLAQDVVIHIVGTKSDIVAQDPDQRMIAFERCLAFVAENLFPDKFSEPVVGSGSDSGFRSVDGISKRSSGLWGQDIGWDCCHEISSSSGEGIEEVFRVITRKLVEQKQKKTEAELAAQGKGKIGMPGNIPYADGPGLGGGGSFRVGYGDKRRSWLGLPTSSIGIGDGGTDDRERSSKHRRKGCC